ncbi:hypothetical protein ACFPYN_05465 [Paenisporosarcina macmurdoensis]|uniref:Lipoprotein n=1 Tax=Paenisporosarcina macmurdoensis TaxID=212659 RepID=A0ABW1L7L0_9BACL
MKKLLPLLLGILLFLVGCNDDTANVQAYSGKNLKIGVIGETPEFGGEKVSFETITFDDLKNNTKKISDDLDAILIMKESLAEADDDQYVTTYNTLKIPIFFMQSTKLHVPFVNEGVDYDEFPEVQSSNYASGFLFIGSDEEYKDQTWRYELKDNEESKSNIQEVFTKIFNTIESISS